MLSKSLVLSINRVCCIICLFSVILFKNSNNSVQIQRQSYKQLIIGRWVFKSQTVGDIIIAFNKDGSGFSKTDSNKVVYKFRYILKGKLLILSTGKYKSDLHYIKQLTLTGLSLVPYPYKKYRESVDLIDTYYIKDDSHQLERN